MALANTTRIANRYGIDLVFHDISATGTDGDITVDFANEVSIEITGDAVYATGEQGHRRLVGFNNPLEGNITISTQIMTPQLMKLIAADDETTNGAVFKTRPDQKYYKVTGATVWKGEDGVTYKENLTAFKCLIQANYSAAYTGDGDPHSVDITVQMFETAEDGLIKFEFADNT